MFTNVTDISDRDDTGLGPCSDSGSLETLIDVYLTETDLAFLDQNRLLVVRDPTVEDGIMVASPVSSISGDGPNIDLDGNITASFALKSSVRFENGLTPLVYSTAHQDGRGEPTGTCVRFFNADEAEKSRYFYTGDTDGV